MPWVNAHGKHIFFVHVPKAGGTSVELYLESRFGPLTMIDRNKQRKLRGTGLIVPVTHLAASDLLELIPKSPDLCFALVRDPLQRILSEYRYQTSISRTSRLSFSAWLRVMIASAQLEPRVYENHIRPQTELVPADAEIFRLEDGLQPVVDRIDHVVGERREDLEPPHANSRTQVPLRLFREDLDLIENFYAEDYTRFGFSPTSRAQLPTDRAAAAKSRFARAVAPMVVIQQRWRWAQ